MAAHLCDDRKRTCVYVWIPPGLCGIIFFLYDRRERADWERKIKTFSRFFFFTLLGPGQGDDPAADVDDDRRRRGFFFFFTEIQINSGVSRLRESGRFLAAVNTRFRVFRRLNVSARTENDRNLKAHRRFALPSHRYSSSLGFWPV